MITVDFGRVEARPGWRILDIGCGTGRHTAEAFRVPQAVVVGMDPSLPDLRAARRRLELHERLGQHGGGRWALCAASGLRLPFAARRFDLVVCAEVLEHVPDDVAVLKEIHRVLAPGGTLAVSVPRRWPERVCWRLSPEYASTPGGHVRVYRRSELERRLATAGFAPYAAHHAHSLHAPFWWLKCLVGVNRTDSAVVRLYERFLTWEIMRRPRWVRWIDRLLNPVLGKSLVLYCRRKATSTVSRVTS
jgi:SAM-dependent methyltransferase